MSEQSRLTVIEPSLRAPELPEVRFAETPVKYPDPADSVLAQVMTPGSLLLEKLRVLRAKIEAIDGQRRLRCIGVVAATPGEGTTTTALGLAVALAREGTRRVLLMEAGLRGPILERRLGLSGARGVSDWLTNGTSAPLLVRHLEPCGVSLLTGGKRCVEPASLLESEGMARLLRAARGAYDFAVVDCPPLTPTADSVLIQDLLDGFVLVVRARVAPREQILQALAQLKPDRVQGVVLNDQDEILGRYRTLRRQRHR